MDHKVRIGPEEITVSVHRASKAVWIAEGEYLGKRIEIRGPTEAQTLGAWQKAAEYRRG